MFNVLALPYFRQRSGLRRSGSGSFLLPDAQPRSGAAWQEPRSPRRSRTKPPLASGPGLIATARAITAAAIVSIEDNVGLLLSASLLEGASTDDTTPTFRGTTSSSTTKTGNTLYLWSRHLVSGVFSLRGSVNLARGISNGSWQITSAPLPQGTHSFFVSTVSTTPTALPPSGSRTLTIDTSAPLLSAAL
ncbi:MAG: hypothetical protein VKI83_08540, partial [Synechococcaceae cyanobacterium]|nr:hypothetical protein [Synechococcaceae cyanobacterium]